jgi:hypothetical protein
LKAIVQKTLYPGKAISLYSSKAMDGLTQNARFTQVKPGIKHKTLNLRTIQPIHCVSCLHFTPVKHRYISHPVSARSATRDGLGFEYLLLDFDSISKKQRVALNGSKMRLRRFRLPTWGALSVGMGWALVTFVT